MIGKKVSTTLFYLRISVFLVMLMWTLDKFINPAHAAAVYENFYFIGGLGNTLLYAIATVELAILLAFVLGLFKPVSYGLVFLFHAVSTLSSYQQYANPFDGPNLLFFAAWPMLAACFALFYLRDMDTVCTLGK